ncbi:MAG: aldolase [Candidatus Latescibacteria bacterium]|nr:aldolase [Candidatus Latescibacterota bacterium]MCK5328937.1 aldolase [Candidatus Latescibacterota bacterium]MCK5733528.1 aldolase [Candidatus Latescibacterota bacterium]
MDYNVGNYRFDVKDFFPKRVMDKITEVRVDRREVIQIEADARRRRASVTKDGKLTILACDHPARRITKSGDDELIMGDRQEYLGRILRVVTDPEFDGVMGTPDILEDLLIVNYLVKEAGAEGFLDGKVMIGCMNRGGLSGVAFEMDDTFTAFTAESLYRLRLDGAKLMFRLDVTNPDSGKTVQYCADAITELNAYDIPAFLEPLPVEWDDSGKKYNIKKTVADLIQTNGVASALGDSSKGTWLKIPYVEGFEQVALSTTCPILMLGGAAKGTPIPTIQEFVDGMKIGGNVRGALVGRNIHFCGADDPCAVAGAIHNVVHRGFDIDQAIEYIHAERGKDMDRLTAVIS